MGDDITGAFAIAILVLFYWDLFTGKYDLLIMDTYSFMYRWVLIIAMVLYWTLNAGMVGATVSWETRDGEEKHITIYPL